MRRDDGLQIGRCDIRRFEGRILLGCLHSIFQRLGSVDCITLTKKLLGLDVHPMEYCLIHLGGLCKISSKCFKRPGWKFQKNLGNEGKKVGNLLVMMFYSPV